MPYSVKQVKPYINCLVYSNPGVGKTTLAGMAAKHPEMSPVLVLNIEGGLLSVAGLDNVDAEDIKSISHLEEIFWKLVNKEPEYSHYKTVVIDSGSELQTLDLEQIARKAWEDDQKRPASQRKRSSVDDLWQADYGENTAKMKRIFRWFKDAPFNVIITALVRENYAKKKTKDSPPRLESVTPAFTEKLGQSVMGYCDMVWYLFISEKEGEEGTRCLLTQQQGVYRAKTRGQKFSSALGVKVDDPDLAEIYELLIASEGLDTQNNKNKDNGVENNG